MLPGVCGQLSEGPQFGELRFVIGVVNRARTKAITQTERNVVSLHDFADLIEMRVKEIFLMMREAPLRHD